MKTFDGYELGVVMSRFDRQWCVIAKTPDLVLIIRLEDNYREAKAKMIFYIETVVGKDSVKVRIKEADNPLSLWPKWAYYYNKRPTGEKFYQHLGHRTWKSSNNGQ